MVELRAVQPEDTPMLLGSGGCSALTGRSFCGEGAADRILVHEGWVAREVVARVST